jgi:hypothetical protein
LILTWKKPKHTHKHTMPSVILHDIGTDVKTTLHLTANKQADDKNLLEVTNCHHDLRRLKEENEELKKGARLFEENRLLLLGRVEELEKEKEKGTVHHIVWETNLKEERLKTASEMRKIARDDYVNAKTFVGILSDSCDGVWHFLGKNCDELTAQDIIDTELMEREDFAVFNDDWESHH